MLGQSKDRWKITVILHALVTCAVVVLLTSNCNTDEPAFNTSWIEYPAAKRVDQVDVYHGVEVADPYRWLEDEKSDETLVWLAAQDRIAERFFTQLPELTKVKGYLEENWIEGVVSIPIRKGANSFFWESAEGKNHPILYVKKSEDAESEVVFDLNQNDPDGSRSTLPSITVSPRGRYVSFEIHYAGADAAEIHFYDTETDREIAEVIPSSYSMIADWLPDESGFFYTHLDIPITMGQETEKKPGIYRHEIGTPLENDIFIYDRPWQGMYAAMAVLADDEEHLLITDMNIMGSRGGWGVRPIAGGPETKVTWLIDPEPKHRFAFVDSKGSEIYLVTDFEAPNWRIVATDINKPGLENLREVVPESEEPISMYGGTNVDLVVLHEERLYVTYIQHN
ncbi:MAG: hypothetical protein JSV33_13715, partial [bacterium]